MKAKLFLKSLLLFIFVSIGVINRAHGQKATTVRPHKSAQSPALEFEPGVRKGKLSNGFTYYIRHNEEPKGRVLFYLSNKVGSLLETDDQQGLAHFMEHMNFNGTVNFPKNSLVDYLQKAGVRFGADINASTGFSETTYQLPLPTDKKDFLEKGLQIMHDWSKGALLDSIEIEKERGVILEEKRQRDGVANRLQAQYMPMLYNHSLYVRRLPIGQEKIIRNFDQKLLKAFYKDWYRPDLQALLVVGDIDVNEMERTIKQKFSDLKNPEPEKTHPGDRLELDGKNEFAAIHDPEATTFNAVLFFKRYSPALLTESDYRKQVVFDLFNSMADQRFWELSNTGSPKFTKATAAIQDFVGGTNLLNLTIDLNAKTVERGFKDGYRELLRLKKYGFLQAELERAKVAYLAKKQTRLKEMNKTSSVFWIRSYMKNFFSKSVPVGIEAEVLLDKKYLPDIHPEDMKVLLNEYLDGKNRDLLFMAPSNEKASLPDAQTAYRWIKDVEQEKLQPFEDTAAQAVLLTQVPTAGKITEEQRDTLVNITRLTLSNGAKVWLKPTRAKADEIIINAFSAGGTSLYGDTEYESAANSATVVMSSGIGNYNALQLEKLLSGKQLRIYPYINDIKQGISGKTTAKDLKTAMEVFYAYFTQPRKDTALFERFLERERMKLLNRANDPNSQVLDSAKIILSNNNPRRTGPSLAKLAQINLDRSFQIYRERFADAGNFAMVIVGAFKLDSIKPLIEKYVASLPAAQNHAAFKDLNINIPAGIIDKTFYMGKDQKATVNLIWSGPFDYSQEQNLLLTALNEVLHIRLVERLREEEGGVYSPSSLHTETKLPQSRYGLNVAFSCAPENADKLVASVQQEIDKLKADGPSAVNLEKFKVEELRKLELAEQSNSYWNSYLSERIEYGENLNLMKAYRKELESVTPEMVKAAANRYLKGDNYIKIIRMPERTVGMN